LRIKQISSSTSRDVNNFFNRATGKRAFNIFSSSLRLLGTGRSSNCQGELIINDAARAALAASDDYLSRVESVYRTKRYRGSDNGIYPFPPKEDKFLMI